ncbi:MAG: ABC transporter [Deltaproteobacteria bacterium RIFCSPLOWO2_12_FULL_60_19]|nr:MAG: ABC transporter [Deltaproteobacteria bacterium RIFCSPLOWO2_12_FULL_60_19]
MIHLDNLSKHYGKLAAVDGLSLEIPAGEIFGFLGPNGAGKTTTIKVMMGILRATSGRVVLGDYDVEKEPEKAKAITGYIPDRPFIYEKLTGGEFLKFVAALHHVNSTAVEERSAELLEHFDLSDWKDELVEGYSHGMKQRLVLCAALIHRPKILIVDEPMVGIDPRGTRKLKDLFIALGKTGVTVFFSTHSVGVAEELCQRVGIIHKGKLIACGTMAELRQLANMNEGSLEAAFLELTRDGSQ